MDQRNDSNHVHMINKEDDKQYMGDTPNELDI